MAVVGASDRPGSFGWRMTTEALRSPGITRSWLVNPRRRTVLDRPCLPSLSDVPDPVDLVLLGVPGHAVAEQVRLASARGDGGAVVYASPHGPRDELLAAAGGLELCGPGCMGFVNAARGVRAIGYLERDPVPAGPIALVTHSGSMFSALLRTHRRLEYSLVVSSGQELVTTTADYLAYALSLPETRVVGLVLETLRDAPALRSALAAAAESDVPVVALTVGSSRRGRSLVDAHSGALAGSDAAWEALFAAYGVHRVRRPRRARRQPGDLRDRAAGPPPGAGHRDRARLGGRAGAGGRRGRAAGSPVRAARGGYDGAPGRGPRARPGTHEPTRRLGHRRRGDRPVRRLPDGARRRRRGGRGGAGGRPGAGVRRRRRVPAGTRPARWRTPTSRWWCSRTSPRRSTRRWPPTCGRAASPSSKAPGPGSGPWRTSGRRRPGRTGWRRRSRRRSTSDGGPAGPLAWRAGDVDAAALLADYGIHVAAARAADSEASAVAAADAARLPGRAQDGRPGHPPQGRRGWGAPRPRRRGCRPDRVGGAGGAAGTVRDRPGAGPGRGRDGPRPVARPAPRAARARRGGRHAGGAARPASGGAAAGRAGHRAAPGRHPADLAACSPAIAAAPPSTSTGWSPPWWRCRRSRASWATSSTPWT